MSVLQLTAESFHRTVSASACLVVEFRAPSAETGALAELSQRHAPIVVGRIDIHAEPELAALFGVHEGPALLIFREQVVLYLKAGEHSIARIEEILQRALALDMNAVRPEIDEQKRAEVALRMRRVCPATRRGQPPRA